MLPTNKTTQTHVLACLLVGKPKDARRALACPRQSGADRESGAPLSSLGVARRSAPITACEDEPRRRNQQHVHRPTQGNPILNKLRLKVAYDRSGNCCDGNPCGGVFVEQTNLGCTHLPFPSIGADQRFISGGHKRRPSARV